MELRLAQQLEHSFEEVQMGRRRTEIDQYRAVIATHSLDLRLARLPPTTRPSKEPSTARDAATAMCCAKCLRFFSAPPTSADRAFADYQSAAMYDAPSTAGPSSANDYVLECRQDAEWRVVPCLKIIDLYIVCISIVYHAMITIKIYSLFFQNK